MALCLNPKCQKKVSDNSSSCPFCGGSQIAEFNSYTKSESLVDDLSIENFHKVVKNSRPFIERTILSGDAKASFKSKLVVRLQFLVRKIFKSK